MTSFFLVWLAPDRRSYRKLRIAIVTPLSISSFPRAHDRSSRSFERRAVNHSSVTRQQVYGWCHLLPLNRSSSRGIWYLLQALRALNCRRAVSSPPQLTIFLSFVPFSPLLASLCVMPLIPCTLIDVAVRPGLRFLSTLMQVTPRLTDSHDPAIDYPATKYGLYLVRWPRCSGLPV